MHAWRHWSVTALLFCSFLQLHTLFASCQVTVPPLPTGTSRDDTVMPDLAKLSPFERTIYLSARRGADWLWRMNRADGLFAPGQVPALGADLDESDYIRQAGAAVALARAARFAASSRYEMRAKQAVLLLLAETKLVVGDDKGRIRTSLPSVSQRLAGAGMVLWAIHELPQPSNDLIQHADELALFICKQQQPDGSFNVADEPLDHQPKPAGIALLGLMHSHAHRPIVANLETARKALPFYRDGWQKQRTPEATAWLVSAFAQAYFVTKDVAFAEALTPMADWLCTLQIGLDPKNPSWQGGFGGWQSGRMVSQQPTIETALFALAIADACRVARQSGDAERALRCRETVERALQFVARLQYTGANMRHFADWYQQQLYGAFFASPQDGNTRLDYAQYAVCAMCQYLDEVAEASLHGK